MTTTWRQKLCAALVANHESASDILANSLTDDEMDLPFDSGYGDPEGAPFTVWTEASVYFPVCYDGCESVGRVSRYPDGRPTKHIGGGW